MAKLVEMRNISKSFFGVEVLHGVDFSLKSGEVAALCGENGAGKSTLMKILAAVYSLDSGEIKVNGCGVHKGATALEMQRVGVSMIHQELNLLDDMTVAQNIFLSREPRNRLGLIDFKKMNADAQKLIESLSEQISPTDKVRTLKIAQKQMVEIAKAISFDIKVLIMDEPTSMLTARETEVLFALTRELARKGLGIVYISHRLKEIKQICDTVTVLRDGSLVAVRNTSDVTEREIASLMVGREVQQSIAGQFAGHSNDVMLEVRNLSDSMLKGISFSVRRGEIMGFSGLVGAGRSELLEHIFGLRKRASGEIIVNGKAAYFKRPIAAIGRGIGFATEDRKETGLVLCRSIEENVNHVFQVKGRRFFNSSKTFAGNTKKMAERLSIKFQSRFQPASNLSGGNQQKIVLSKWLLVDSEILLLDEPTRGIDVGAREEIYRIINELAREGKAIIIVSSDLTEVLSICQRIIVMHEGRITGEYEGPLRTEENIMKSATNV